MLEGILLNYLGAVELQCIDLEGDNQTVASVQKAGVLEVKEC